MLTLPHLTLFLACAALLCAIIAQDWLVPSLRNNTISAGLTGHYHVMLDVAYVPLSLGLWMNFHSNPVMWLLAIVSGAALLGVAATNTAWRFFDAITNGKHALWHSRLTITVFVSAIALQVAGDVHTGHYWWFTVLNVALPAGVYVLFHYDEIAVEGVIVKASPAAEKLFVAQLCFWLMLAVS